MKTVNEMKLSFPSKSCNEAFARSAVSAFIMNLDPTLNELSDLKTAVSEAVTNCMRQGHGEDTRQGLRHCRRGAGDAAAVHHRRG